jgi:hypothetical protein
MSQLPERPIIKGCMAYVDHDQLVADAGYYGRVGERTFWNWYQTLDDGQRRVVKEYMESIPEE